MVVGPTCQLIFYLSPISLFLPLSLISLRGAQGAPPQSPPRASRRNGLRRAQAAEAAAAVSAARRTLPPPPHVDRARAGGGEAELNRDPGRMMGRQRAAALEAPLAAGWRGVLLAIGGDRGGDLGGLCVAAAAACPARGGERNRRERGRKREI